MCKKEKLIHSIYEDNALENSSFENPIVLSNISDFVKLEYLLIAISSEHNNYADSKFLKQELRVVDGKTYDILTITRKTEENAGYIEKVFYFDISESFGKVIL